MEKKKPTSQLKKYRNLLFFIVVLIVCLVQLVNGISSGCFDYTRLIGVNYCYSTSPVGYVLDLMFYSFVSLAMVLFIFNSTSENKSGIDEK